MSTQLQESERLHRLSEFGQSYWLDNLTREMIDSGELERRVAEEGLRGVTSNPKTFAVSVQAGEDYDRDIENLAREGKSDQEIYEQLMIDDVARGCDVLKPVFDKTGGRDGFVSIEVDPRLARQTEATLDAARSLWKRVGKKNVMVKIPGTPEGLAAIEEALFEGINVNITLLFSNERYRQVAAHYLRALRRRNERGDSVEGIASVASFFLSRIDVLVDELLEHRGSPIAKDALANRLRGKAAIAQAKLAYGSFKEAFLDQAGSELEARGAAVQRPLWASTSVKTEGVPDTLYVDSLIADQTVNTMPEKTIEAFADHGNLKRDAIEAVDMDPREILNGLESLGISLDYVAQRLEDEGIQKFIDPFEEGFAAVAKQAERHRR